MVSLCLGTTGDKDHLAGMHFGYFEGASTWYVLGAGRPWADRKPLNDAIAAGVLAVWGYEASELRLADIRKDCECLDKKIELIRHVTLKLGQDPRPYSQDNASGKKSAASLRKGGAP